jgi:hypothetical protein
MRQRRDPFRELDAFSAVRSWVDCTTNMSGFDLRQAQRIEKSNGYALQSGWVEAYDRASRPAFDRLQPVLGRASDAG